MGVDPLELKLRGTRRSGMGGHESSHMINDEWLTPPEIIRALGDFDLDPCAPIVRPWSTALTHYTREDDGLVQDWFGRIWCNPPYGAQTSSWLEKLADHGNGIALIFARTETSFFFRNVWDKADSVFFFRGRLHFYDVQGIKAAKNAGAPSCLVAYGQNNVAAIGSSQLTGHHVYIK